MDYEKPKKRFHSYQEFLWEFVYWNILLKCICEYFLCRPTLVDKVHEKSRFIHNLYTKIAIYAKSVHKNRDLYTSQKKIHKNRDFCSRINRDFRVTYMLNYLIHKNRDFCSCINRDFCDKYMLNHLIHKNRDFCSRINRDFCDIYMLNH